MKQLNVRLDDELHARLREVESISEFIRDAIKEKLDGKSKGSSDLISIEAMLDERVELLLDAINNFQPAKQEEFKPAAPDPGTGYACCLNEVKPCKHWQWDGVKQSYLNLLTGELKNISL